MVTTNYGFLVLKKKKILAKILFSCYIKNKQTNKTNEQKQNQEDLHFSAQVSG